MTTKESVPATADLCMYIDFKYFGERPHIRGPRIWVSMIAANEQANQWRISELAADFSLSEEEVLAAILYYPEHKEEIDHQDEGDTRLGEEMCRPYGEKPPCPIRLILCAGLSFHHIHLMRFATRAFRLRDRRSINQSFSLLDSALHQRLRPVVQFGAVFDEFYVTLHIFR